MSLIITYFFILTLLWFPVSIVLADKLYIKYNQDKLSQYTDKS